MLLSKQLNKKFSAFVLVTLYLLLASFATTTTSASAQEVETCASIKDVSTAGTIHIAATSGLLDDVTYSYLIDRLNDAEKHGNSAGFIIKVDSPGSVLSKTKYNNLAQRLVDSPLTTGIWIGQNGAQAQGGTAELIRAVDKVGITPDSVIGKVGEPRLPANFGKPLPPELKNKLLSDEEAVLASIAVGPPNNPNLNPGGNLTSPSIKQFLDHFEEYKTIECLNENGNKVQEAQTIAEISSLPFGPQFFHSAASPEIAYLFLFLGLGLLLFEFFTAGVGIAGLLGAGLFTLSSYGLFLLPVRTWALVLIFVAMFLFAIDIQTNVPNFYSILGLLAFTVGSIFLYDNLSMSKVTLVIGLLSAALYVYTAMPAMVRTRFSTPTIGRSWMIGHDGEAKTTINPEGTVLVNDVPWRAITNRATPIKKGEPVKVTGIDHLTLEVEPLEGAAKDYRERK